ncbi:integrin alpha-4 [Latimeria chalumnae]|uniref:integrin alpha-4 n=1 Tax=Latimeria chalumnae TaxID=7897 RepID=UPI0003C17E6F|nr:PREDICTED: integrin alpha-4 [Latimeria chalumnae]|eukprot:XP_005998780.1 PREDICTED: integrin alpha-4 [Latimeria chalumnae]
MQLKKFGQLFTSAALCLWCISSGVSSYNLDLENPLVYTGPNGSLFGYSVLLHEDAKTKWLVVGAPKSNWPSNQSVANPGAIYRCGIGNNPNRTCELLQLGGLRGEWCGKTCIEERDNQWLGVSLSRQPKEKGFIVACGHRWKNTFYMKNENKLPHGMCYKIPSDLQTRLSQRLTPCYKDYHRKFGEEYGSCQAGISSFFIEDIVIMGAPGSFYWTGSVITYNTTENTFIRYVDEENIVKFGSYLGYSVGAGHFTSPTSIEFIGGAPQQEQIGRAFIFKDGGKSLSIIFEAKGKKLGSYFGAAVCAVDLNSDGLSDLLVGAPMHSIVREEGRVFAYINRGSAAMTELEMELVGRDSYAARFGETIANLGDIDDDGFADVAIGAPQEEDLQGAIYIYNGRKNGISPSFSQRITGLQIGYALSMFGQSISGDIDADGNGYLDVAVGSFMSDSAVLLRTRPVVIVEASLILPKSVNRTKPECTENGQPAVCMNVTLCFSYKGREIPGHIVLLYNLITDAHRKEGLTARFFTLNETSNGTLGKMEIYHHKINCRTHQAFMKKDVRDVLMPIHFEATYHLGDHVVEHGTTDSFPPLQPILQQKEGDCNTVQNKTIFARYCAWEDCSANLLVSGRVTIPGASGNKTYITVGSMKTLILDVSLHNIGDDAYQTVLSVRLPRDLYFSKILELEEKYISCEVTDEGDQLTRLDCTVGYLYVNAMTKTDISFLLDASKLTRAEDQLSITLNATCANENKDLLHNNVETLNLPLRYEADLKVRGTVSPSSFMFGADQQSSLQESCKEEIISFAFQIINVGPSLVPSSNLEIMIPNTVFPDDSKLFRIQDIKTSDGGNCSFRAPPASCSLPETEMDLLQELVFFFSKPYSRSMYCMKEDSSCLQIICQFTDIQIEKEEKIYVYLLLNPSVLEKEGASVFEIETRTTVSSRGNPKIIEVHKDPFAFLRKVN